MDDKTLTKADIIEAIYEKSSKNRSEVRKYVESLLALSKTAIKDSNSLLISGLGKFDCYAKDARRGRNPQTKSALMLPPRKVVVFRLSRKFRAELNG